MVLRSRPHLSPRYATAYEGEPVLLCRSEGGLAMCRVRRERTKQCLLVTLETIAQARSSAALCACGPRAVCMSWSASDVWEHSSAESARLPYLRRYLTSVQGSCVIIRVGRGRSCAGGRREGDERVFRFLLRAEGGFGVVAGAVSVGRPPLSAPSALRSLGYSLHLISGARLPWSLCAPGTCSGRARSSALFH